MRTNEPNWTKIWTDVSISPGDERHARHGRRRRFQAAPHMSSATVVNRHTLKIVLMHIGMHYALGVVSLVSLLLTQIRHEHPKATT